MASGPPSDPVVVDCTTTSADLTGDNDTCLQLALEGEKLCKSGNCRDGVAFFEAALQVMFRNLFRQFVRTKERVN